MKKILYTFLVIFILLTIVFSFWYVFFRKEVHQTSEGRLYGVSSNEILLGSSLALTGNASFLGTNFLYGGLAYFGRINESGGINGRKINLVYLDDQYDPARTVLNTQSLINDQKVFALFNFLGTPTAIKAMPIVEKENIPLVGLFTGASFFREPVKRNIFNIRASYDEEVEVAVSYFTNNLKFKRIAVFYQADTYGLAGLRGAEKALVKRGLEPIAAASYVRGTVAVEDAAASIAKADPEAVIMVGTYSPTAKFVKILKSTNSKIVFHSVSFVGPEKLAEELGPDADGLIVTSVVPPLTMPEEIFHGKNSAVDYKNDLAQYYPNIKPTFEGLEGYVGGIIVAEALQSAGFDITYEKFINALEKIKNFDVGVGSLASFSPTDHQALKKVYLNIFRNNDFYLLEEN